MTYAVSDTHGCSLSDFHCLLSGAGFGDSDFLFVLGDVIDRNGDGGIAMLRWLSLQPNVQLIMGNHESMLLSCDFLFREITDDSLSALDAEKIALLANWMSNGARPTLTALRALSSREPSAVGDLLDFLRDAPLYETASVGGRDFVLTHSGLGGFSPEKPLSAYAPDELLWHRPTPDERYFDDVTTVFGHTPTRFYGSPQKIFKTETWIDIDVGAGMGAKPALLRLDDLREFCLE